MHLTRAQRTIGVLGLLLLIGLVLCPRWQMRTEWVPMDVGGGTREPVATIAVTWHRWLWNRPADAVGIAWPYMASEAGAIVGGTLVLMVLAGVLLRVRRLETRDQMVEDGTEKRRRHAAPPPRAKPGLEEQ